MDRVCTFTPSLSPTNRLFDTIVDSESCLSAANRRRLSTIPCISKLTMAGPIIPKRLMAARTASAAERDAKEARLQLAASELGNETYTSIRQAAAANNHECAQINATPSRPGPSAQEGCSDA